MTNKPQDIEVIRTDADGISNITGRALVVLEISRREIETNNFTSALERLHVLSDTRESVLRYKESLAIMVNGYDGDPRELSEIPEVRAYFANLTAQWPHWLWFLVRDMGVISLLLSILCRVKVHRRGSRAGIEFLDPDELESKLDDLFARGIALYEAFDISPEDAEASAASALKEITG